MNGVPHLCADCGAPLAKKSAGLCRACYDKWHGRVKGLGISGFSKAVK